MAPISKQTRGSLRLILLTGSVSPLLLALSCSAPPKDDIAVHQQPFGSNFVSTIEDAHGHSWIMFKALQYLNARGLTPAELQGPDASRNLVFGESFADDVFMGRPDQYYPDQPDHSPDYIWTPPDDELWTETDGEVCECIDIIPPSELNPKPACVKRCQPGKVISPPPPYYYAYASAHDSCDFVPEEYFLSFDLRTISHSQYLNHLPASVAGTTFVPSTYHRTCFRISVEANFGIGTKSQSEDVCNTTDNMFHYPMAELPADGDISTDVKMFPHAASDFPVDFPGDVAGFDGCAAEFLGNQAIVRGAQFGVGKYGSILYQLSRRFFDNDTRWPQPDIADLIKAGNTADIPMEWRNGGIDASPRFSGVVTDFPHTYLGGNPFICTGGDQTDPCREGAPTWPVWVPKDKFSQANKATFKSELGARYPGRNNQAAQVYLGWAAHFVQDANLPHHAANWTGNEHKLQEQAADALASHGERLYKYASTGGYSFTEQCGPIRPNGGGYEHGLPVMFDETKEMTAALAARFDGFTDKGAMCDQAGITDASLGKAGINWPASYGVYVDALKRGRALAKTQNYLGLTGHVPDRLTSVIGVMADAVVDTMKLLYCAPPRSKNADACSSESSCYPGTGDVWNQGTVGETGQRYPIDFNVFAFGNVTSVMDVQGPVAAGGTISTSSFNLNWGEQQPVALVTEGYPMLGTGTISGAVYRPQGYYVPGGVTLNGSVVESGIDFEAARTKLVSMSETLRDRPSNGSADVDWGVILKLDGKDIHLNVFNVSQATLGVARLISFHVPSGSTVVVNVTGSAPWIVNAGIALSGVDAGHLLWNFPDATTLTMRSVGFPGSILAPHAAADLQWGDIRGTLVADTVFATSEFHFAPFHDNWLAPR